MSLKWPNASRKGTGKQELNILAKWKGCDPLAISDTSAKSFLNELRYLSQSLLWKNQYEATECEPDGRRTETEAYIAARNGTLRFNDIGQFHESVMEAVIPASIREECYTNKRLIPEEYRETMTQMEAALIIDEWENKDGEQNDYYRMLFGLPPISETNFAYNTRYADIDMETPIHLLEYADRLTLEKRGYIDELLSQEANADKKYLRYVGKYRTYPYVARQADRFELIYLPESQYKYLRQDFIDTYEANRKMIVRVYYSDAFKNSSNIYEGFIGMCILFMTQQQMYSKYLQADITRNFYDLESLKLVYDAYSVPFFPSIPLKYHTKIVKMINELISYKGSVQVFYDLFNLFDFGKMEVFEYYLIKHRITDENGNPVFFGPDGEELPNEKKFNIGFSRVGYHDDKYVELTNPDNFVSFEELTDPDPYWVSDPALMKKLYDTDWNYFHSKYMGVQVMFDLAKLLFESTYYMKLLHDNRESLEQLTTYFIATATNVPIYDLVVYAFALLCKDCGYAGEIPSDPASIAAVYGYNFKEHHQLLKMATQSMSDFIRYFKDALRQYIGENDVLAQDAALSFYLDHITDGAFTYTGDDFPYGAGYAPPPVFLHDFTPTNNSVKNLQKYLRDTINYLRTNPEDTEYELNKFYQEFVSSDDMVFMVRTVDESGISSHYQKFMVRRNRDATDEDIKVTRDYVISSYTQLLNWMNRLLEVRRALMFDPHILELIQDMNIEDEKDVGRIYENLESLHEYLNIKIRTSTTVDEYNAFANIRKILMTTGQIAETYQKKNGEVAATFEDLLSDVNRELYLRLKNEDTDIPTELEYVIQTLMKFSQDLVVLEAINPRGLERIIKYLFMILKFFKSAKVDLTQFDIIYLLNSRSMNYLKFLGNIHSTDVTVLNHRDYLYLRSIAHWMYVDQVVEGGRIKFDDSVYSEVSQELRDVFMEITDRLDAHFKVIGNGGMLTLTDFIVPSNVLRYQEEDILQKEEWYASGSIDDRRKTSAMKFKDRLSIPMKDINLKSGMAMRDRLVSDRTLPLQDQFMYLAMKLFYSEIYSGTQYESLHLKDRLIEHERVNLDSSINP